MTDQQLAALLSMVHAVGNRSYIYLTTHNNHKRHTSMPPAGFEPAIPAIEQPQTHALDRAGTGIG